MPVTHFIWDELSDNVRMEVDDAGALTAEYMNEPGQFGSLISQRRNGTISLCHFDAQGSTRQLSNDSEAVTDSYTYTAFGEPVASDGTTSNPFLYYGTWGYYSDEETGEVYVRGRTYGPGIGRWLSIDPLGFVHGPGLYNAYFVPATVDPSGLQLPNFPGFPHGLPVRPPYRIPSDPIDPYPPPIPIPTFPTIYPSPAKDCGFVTFTCPNGRLITVKVIGDAVLPGIILGKGCMTFPDAIRCSGTCDEIKRWTGSSGRRILDHEGCHACALWQEGWCAYIRTMGLEPDGCVGNEVASTPRW